MATREQRRQAKKEFFPIVDFFGIMMKFFSGLGPLSKGLEDHRHQSYVRYAPDILLLTLILKQASGLKSMRRIDEEMNDDNVIVSGS